MFCHTGKNSFGAFNFLGAAPQRTSNFGCAFANLDRFSTCGKVWLSVRLPVCAKTGDEARSLIYEG